MMYAVKGNTQLKIDEAERSEYLKLGYDIAEVNGDTLETIEVSPAKTIPFKDHEALKTQLAAVEAENAELKDQLADAKKSTKKEA